MDEFRMALQNLVGEFGIFAGHLVSVKTESTEGRVAGRHGSLRGFPGENGFPHAPALGSLLADVAFGVALDDLRSRRWLVRFHLLEHFGLLAFLFLGLLAGLLHLLGHRRLLLRGGGLHLLLLLLGSLLLRFARAFAPASEPSYAG
jgi:hypothetical protein